MSVVTSSLITDSLTELNVLAEGESCPAWLSTLALGRLNQLFNDWNVQPEAVYTEVFTPFTLTPNLSPHTIGPVGATFTLAIRPVKLYGCSLNLNIITPNVYLPIDIIDAESYQSLSVPDIATSIPTAIYYETDWPLGKLFFYPVPDAAYGVRFLTRTLFGVVTLTATIDLPPGYESALMYTLAERLATPVGRAAPAATVQMAKDARARIFDNNIVVPSLNLQDGQQPAPRLTTFNYHSRQFS